MAGSEMAEAPGGFKFPRSARLRKGKDILRVLKTGSSVGSRGMKLCWLPRGEGQSRMAIALRRGYGNAVQRNRAKRLVREAWRMNRARVRGAWDIVFQIFPAADLWAERSRQLEGLLSRSGLAAPSGGKA